MESEGMNLLKNSAIVTVLIGACVLLLMYIIKLLNADPKNVEQKRKNEKQSDQTEKKKDSGASAKTKKKSSEARWSGRSDKQAFSHPWLLTTLKGHTSQVLDMEFSSNGKYLASCGEEEPDSGDDPGLDTGSSCGNSSDSNRETSSPSSTSSSPRTKGLSRRQRKNRRREDHSPPENKKKQKSKRSKTVVTQTKIYEPINLYSKLLASFASEERLTMCLRRYTMKPPTLMALGYPVEFPEFPGQTVIIKDSPKLPWYKCKESRDTFKSRLDVNAREFVPGSDYYDHKSDHDSGQGSGNSSDSSEGLDDTSLHACSKSKNENYLENIDNQACQPHLCVRCDKNFFITANNKYLTKEKCIYHWGKLQKVEAPIPKYSGPVYQYMCCQGSSTAPGCTMGKCHVWNGVEPGCNGPLEGFVYIRPRRPIPLEKYYKAYALDCEMCYTVKGLELTKVTVVDMNGRMVYDTFVKPANHIIDYNTRFSGITAKDLQNGAKTLKEVQKDLMDFLHAGTILIGHGLENDLRALKIIHNNCIDTSILFQSPVTVLPKRHSLKHLSSYLLNKDIQCSSNGHNSYEDARTAMELALYKMCSDCNLKVD